MKIKIGLALLLIIAPLIAVMASEYSAHYIEATNNWKKYGYKSKREASIAYQAAFRSCYEVMSVNFPGETYNDKCHYNAKLLVSKLASYENSGNSLYR